MCSKILFLALVLMLVTIASCASVWASPTSSDPSEKTVLDLFVMSYCPYAIQTELELIPLVQESPEKVDLRVHYIVSRNAKEARRPAIVSAPRIVEENAAAVEGRDHSGFASLHGKEEIEENIRQLLIHELYPERFLDYLILRAENMNAPWRDAASRLRMDTSLLDEMIQNGTGESLLDEDLCLARDRGITASPTLFINGARFSGRISKETIKTIAGGNANDGAPGIRVAHQFSHGPDDRVNKNAGQDPRVGTGNPAAVYCSELGYEYLIVSDQGNQRGACFLPSGEACDAWEFLQGKCGQEYSYCAEYGYEVRTLDDGRDPFSREYAACFDEQGELLGSVTELMGLRALTVRSNSGSHRRSDGSRGIDPPSRLTQAPPVFDWRDYNGANWITPIKDQGNCGSCWAFATIGTVEAMYNIRAGYPELDPDLSEQYLVSDCHIAPFYDQNCCGGSGRIALRYVRDYGIPDEDCMPYVDGYFNGCTCSDNTCDWNCEHSTGDDCSDTICDDRCSDWNGRLRNIDSTDALDTPDEIKENIAYLGPATASMCMGTANCGAYWDGDVYRCEVDDDTDHLVVLVGYDDAGQYWIAKNSWGSNWEDGGYFKIGYGECSIETWAYNADKALHPRQRIAVQQ